MMAYWWFGFLIAGFIFLDRTDAQSFDRFLTVRNILETLNFSGRSLLICNPTDESTNRANIVRALDTGLGLSLPNNTQLVYNPAPLHMITLFLLPNITSAVDARFGAYSCEETIGNVTTRATAFKLPLAADAEVTAEHRYLRASQGESIKLKVKVVYQPVALKWKLNGHVRPEWDNLTEVVIDAITANDSGIYECFYEGHQELGLHALMYLTVRGCPPNRWGELCDNDCPPCYNGGVCNAEFGVCVCPPGFDGHKCEKACEANSFGEGCEKICDNDPTAVPEDACAAFIFCLPDPYGCSCGAGFKGRFCYEDCTTGTYGAGCLQTCHCKEGPDSCDRITGECDDGCAFGWAGESCQIAIKNTAEYYNASGVAFQCPLGNFGFPYCNGTCHCNSGNACDPSTGICALGCADGWNGTTCSECSLGLFGANCKGACHCELGFSACDVESGVCTGGCGPGYIGENCQEECPPSKYGPNCSFTCFCQNGGRCNPINGSCECVSKWRGNVCDESLPEILVAKDMEGNVGTVVNVTCLVRSRPPASVQIWSLDYPGLESVVVQQNQSFQLAYTELELNNASLLRFNCSATNSHGMSATIIVLTSVDPPVLSSRPVVLSRSSNSIELEWDSWQWGKDEGGLDGDHIEYRVMYRYEWQDEWSNLNNWASITGMRVTGTLPGTTYEFAVQCRRKGTGGAGKPGPFITVATACKPNQDNTTWPQDFRTEQVATNHVNLQWTEPTNFELLCPLQKYILQFWPKEKPDTKGPSIEVSGGQEHYLLDGLESGTVYVVELSVLSEDVVVGMPASMFVTPHTAMTDAVEGLQSEAVTTSTEAHVSWHEPIQKKAPITKYLVNFQLVDRGKCGHKHSNVTTHDVEVAGTEVILSLLFPYSNYEVNVQPLTALGPGEIATIQVVTNEGNPAIAPPDVRITIISPTSLGFRWAAIPCEESHGMIIHYEYKLTKNNSTRDRRKKRSTPVSYLSELLPANQMEVIVQNLTSNEAYEFVVRGLTAAGPGPWSNGTYQKTLVDVPSSPLLIVWKVTSSDAFVYIQRPVKSAGAITAYQLKWTTSNGSTRSYHITKLTDPSSFNYTVLWLQPTTCYELMVQARSLGGWSDQSASVSVCTKDQPPGSPRELEMVRNSAMALTISWQPPYPPEGILIGYRIRYRLAAVLDGTAAKAKPSQQEEIELHRNLTTTLAITALEPLSQYEVEVVAYNQHGESSPVKKLFSTTTDNAGSKILPPPPPIRVFSSEVMTDAVPVRIFPVTRDHDSIRSYQLIVEDVNLNNEVVHGDFLGNFSYAMRKDHWFYIAAEITASDVSDFGYPFVVGDNNTYGGYWNAPLQPSHSYRFHLRSTGIDKKMMFSSLTVNEEVVQTLNQSVKSPHAAGASPSVHDECMGLGLSCVWFLIIIIALTVLVILFLLLICCGLWRKHNHGFHQIRHPSSKVWVDGNKQRKSQQKTSRVSTSRTYSVSYSVSDAQVNAESGPVVCGVPAVYDSKVISKDACRRSWLDGSPNQGAIPVSMLVDYVQSKIRHPTFNFQEEFKQLLIGQVGTWIEAKKTENLKKNRYGNILPYDHTRVCLQPLPHVLHSDYINASFIDGYKRKRAYIAAQGPKENYFADFWRMVWQENTAAIVMVTGLVEMGRIKCDQYWPNDSCTYGDLHITIMEIHTAIDAIIRLFMIQKISTAETRRLRHYQLLDWPDQSVPMYASPLLALRNRILRETPDNAGPIIVHCSAGIGRTGTFIAVDALLRQAAEEDDVDIFSYVNKIRLQRINMVQTLEQYIFIHETLLEALECKDTKVMISHLSTYIKDITAGADSSALQSQFQKLAELRIQLDWHHCTKALNETNLNKNRDLAILPSDTRRVRLSTLHRCCSSDYINAVFCDGYKLRNLFMPTQIPLPHTTEDFWAMVSCYRSSVVVVLHGTGMKEGLTNCGEYWPTEGFRHYGRYQVQVVTFQRRDLYIEQNLKLIDEHAAANDEPQRIVQLQFTGEWLDEDNVPSSPAAMATLIHQAEAWHRRLGGPITVLCMDGACRCGLFCVGGVIAEQLRVEGAADVFQVVRRMQKHRPAMIYSPAQYQFCYELALALVEE